MAPPRRLPPDAFLDTEHDDSWIGLPPPVYGPEKRPAKTGSELDELIRAGGLPEVVPERSDPLA